MDPPDLTPASDRATSVGSDRAPYCGMVAGAMDLIIFTTDPDGVITSWPPGAAGIFQRAEGDVLGKPVHDLFGPELRKDILRAAGANRGRYWLAANGERRLCVDIGWRRLPHSADTLLWTGYDATAQQGLQDKQKALITVLQHRIRNMLANIRSIVHRSSRTSDTVEDLSMHLEGRIDSIARTQLMLARNPQDGLELEDMIREELLANSVPESSVTIEGPAVHLSARAAEIMMFAIHELATNAVKFGALTSSKGAIRIVWLIAETGGQGELHFSWVETGVSVAAISPRRKGFGSELITRRVPYELSGTGTFELHPGGLHASIMFPLRPGGQHPCGRWRRCVPGPLSDL